MKWLTIIAAIVGLYVACLWIDYPTSNHRFRLTVTVKTPLGPRTGSSVMEAVVVRRPGWTALREGMVSHASLVGEAVVVDLGPTQPSNLIALLAWGPLGTSGNADFADIHRQAYFDYLGIRHQKYPGAPPKRIPPFKVKLSPHECENGEDMWCIIGKYPVGTKMEIRDDLIPTLITLRNADDPASAQVVPPNSLHGTFGTGYSLDSVMLQIVKPSSWPLSLFGVGGEPLTQEIETQFPKVFKSFAGLKRDRPYGRLESQFVLWPEQLKLPY